MSECRCPIDADFQCLTCSRPLCLACSVEHRGRDHNVFGSVQDETTDVLLEEIHRGQRGEVPAAPDRDGAHPAKLRRLVEEIVALRPAEFDELLREVRRQWRRGP